jgi:type IV pilus assembly protein PilW
MKRSSTSFPMMIRATAVRERGFTLIEMMVALTIGMVIVLGFAVSFVNLKTTFRTQDNLSQLQDNERLAMTFLTASIQEAGYYPDTSPPSQSRTLALKSSSDANFGNTAVAQYLMGTVGGGAASGDSISTVYASASGDGMLTCQGGANTTGSTRTIRNVFYVDSTAHALVCLVYSDASATTAPGATVATLVSNVQSMTAQYAVDTDGDAVADTYLDANGVTASNHWNDIKSVRVTLAFINPNAAATGSATTIQWTQTINLMNNR